MTRSGRRKKGAIEAETMAEARRRLREAGVHVAEMRESQASAPAAAGSEERRGRIRAQALAAATRQLATLLRAGMALAPALGALVEQLAGQPLGGVMARVRDQVTGGASFASALEEHSQVFSDFYVNMVRAGEAAGDLESILLRLAELLERRVALRNKVRAALAYPAFLAAVGVCAVAFLLSFVIPSVTKLFLEMNRQLPWPTRALIGASDFVRDYFWLIAAAVIVAYGAFRMWTRTEDGGLAWDRFKLRAPLTGDLSLKIAVSRFARTLGVLLGSGVSILDALAIARRLAGNRAIAGAIDAARESVGRGQGLAEPLKASGVFPPMVFHMVAVGESSGSVEGCLLNVAESYESEIEAKTIALMSLIEPVVILVMGAVVGFIVVAILLPVFEINQAIR
ncbi:MAG TPA: type II secretion system inner membrane protein GspF [Candidatus Brocadiia bacterium]|nr:type II secretion system inner membrane protein GspF [Candidatus Brocadiia bacterium]